MSGRRRGRLRSTFIYLAPAQPGAAVPHELSKPKAKSWKLTARSNFMREVVIASSVRTAVGKSGKGTLRATRPDDLAAAAINGALERIPQLDKKEIEDVIIGCATPEAEQGMNVARIASLRAGLPVEVSAMTINRFCSSGLQAISLAVDSVAAGRAE